MINEKSPYCCPLCRYNYDMKPKSEWVVDIYNDGSHNMDNMLWEEHLDNCDMNLERVRQKKLDFLLNEQRFL